MIFFSSFSMAGTQLCDTTDLFRSGRHFISCSAPMVAKVLWSTLAGAIGGVGEAGDVIDTLALPDRLWGDFKLLMMSMSPSVEDDVSRLGVELLPGFESSQL
ncbi:hypothetical protein HC762_01110 [bacterium]|nr:hypothetical protein [bacterium]